MKERPILFAAAMVRAILDGRKTQTRRVLKNQPEIIKDPFPTTDEVKGVFKFKESTGIYQCLGMQNLIETCPYGQPGDRLWVRETWAQHPQFADIVFKADGEEFEDSDGFTWVPKWTPSIHMPRKVSRISLEIIGVRIEPLQEISETDAMCEGVELVRVSENDYRFRDYEHDEQTFGKPSQSFASLFDSINGQGSWDKNPWVWVLEFKRC
jgi:hypothetical protein